MTDKQSTVVVSRELAERITRPQLKPRDETVQRRAISELRALLAATPEQAVDVGEAVAYYAIVVPRIMENGEAKEWMPAFVWFTPDQLSSISWPYKITDRLYRHAQPPTQTRITMADTMRAYQSAARTPHLVGTSNWCAHMAEQLNQCSEVATLCGGAPNIGGQTPTIAATYRCHLCGNETPPPEPYKLYVSCECGATTAASAAMAELKP